jgi:hypothetical protein
VSAPISVNPAEKELIEQSRSDFEFVSRELVRFLQMSGEQLMAHLREHRRDALCTIPDPSGRGHLICGVRGWQSLGEIADRLEQFDSSLARRVDLDALTSCVVTAYVDVVLKEKRDIDFDSTHEILKKAARLAKDTLSTTEHYVPCVFFMFGGPQKFSIGPVTFTRTRAFFREKRLALRESIDRSVRRHIAYAEEQLAKGYRSGPPATEQQHRKHARDFQAHAIRAYRQFPWVASVTVVDCDDRVSQQIAERTVETGLNVTRLVLGAYHTEKVRLGWNRGLPVKTANLWSDKDGTINVRAGSSALGPVGAENWHDGLERASQEVSVCGSAISALVNPTTMSELVARFIDAINWFGDAATDAEAGASIVKYASAIERLLFGDYEPGRTKAFIGRIAAMAREFEWDDASIVAEAAKRMYKVRSSLVHGSSSPRDPGLNELAAQAHKLARISILSATQLYPLITKALRAHATSEQLETIMAQIERDGLQPLLSKARA